MKPKYPVYIISKGRADKCYTADFMLKDGVDFKLVIEKPEYEQYRAKYHKDLLTVLPFADLGMGGIPARNWVWEDAIKTGAERHWIFDDNIRLMRRLYRGKRIPVSSKIALPVLEDFTDRYTNIAISGFNYYMFVMNGQQRPFVSNVHVYSSLLIRNDLPYRWRGRYNEDTDLCLQVLSGGWTTVLFNAFMIEKIRSMAIKGGNTDELYKGDGRLKMARELERNWPNIVRTERRYGRPQHVIDKSWGNFDTPLKRRTDIDWDNMKVNEYGMRLVSKGKVKSKALNNLINEQKNGDKHSE